MDTIRSTLQALCCLSVLCTALGLLLPDGTVKRYVQLVYALAAMALMLRPAAELMEKLMGV